VRSACIPEDPEGSGPGVARSGGTRSGGTGQTVGLRLVARQHPSTQPLRAAGKLGRGSPAARRRPGPETLAVRWPGRDAAPDASSRAPGSRRRTTPFGGRPEGLVRIPSPAASGHQLSGSPAVWVTGRQRRSRREPPPDPLGWRTGRAVGSDPDAKAHERLPRAVGRPRGRVAVTAAPRRTVGAAKKIGPPGARTDGGGRSGGLGRPRSQAERRNFSPSPLTSSSVTTTPPATGRRQRTATDPW